MNTTNPSLQEPVVPVEQVPPGEQLQQVTEEPVTEEQVAEEQVAEKPETEIKNETNENLKKYMDELNKIDVNQLDEGAKQQLSIDLEELKQSIQKKIDELKPKKPWYYFGLGGKKSKKSKKTKKSKTTKKNSRRRR